jgi:hypothetical protein
MFGMSEYLMIAHEVEKARLLTGKTRGKHRKNMRIGAGSTARQATTQRRKNRDE